jgi:pentatricopeptide repeat protein
VKKQQLTLEQIETQIEALKSKIKQLEDSKSKSLTRLDELKLKLKQLKYLKLLPQLKAFVYQQKFKEAEKLYDENKSRLMHNSEALRYMIKVYSHLGQYQNTQITYQNALKHRDVKNCSRSDQPFHITMVYACIRLGKVEEAYTVFGKLNFSDKDLKSSDTNTLNIINAKIKLLFLERKISEVNDLFLQITPNQYTYNIILQGYCQHASFEKIKTFFEEIPNTHKNVYTHTIYLNACIRHNKPVEEIEEVLKNIPKEMMDFENLQNIRLLGTIVNYRVNVGQFGVAQEMFNQIPEKNKTDVLYNIMLKGLSGSGSFDQVLNLFEKIKKDGESSEITYCTMLNAYIRRRPKEKIDTFQQEIDEFIKKIPDTYKDVANPENLMLLDSLLNNLIKSGRLESACNLFKRIPNGYHNSYIANTMLSGISKWSTFEETEKFFQDIPVKNRDAITYSIMLEAMFSKKSQDTMISQSTINRFINSIPPDFKKWKIRQNISLVNSILKNQVGLKHFADAIDKSKDIPKENFDLITYRIVLNAYRACKNIYTDTFKNEYNYILELTESILSTQHKWSGQDKLLRTMLDLCSIKKSELTENLAEQINQEILKISPDNLSPDLVLNNVASSSHTCTEQTSNDTNQLVLNTPTNFYYTTVNITPQGTKGNQNNPTNSWANVAKQETKRNQEDKRDRSVIQAIYGASSPIPRSNTPGVPG